MYSPLVIYKYDNNSLNIYKAIVANRKIRYNKNNEIINKKEISVWKGTNI